ncbi:MAG: methylenetetrahydrofolate reductase [Magnetococcales bacterium]|nr:methylenetetrahydrofolate reductase [Magnetococcales bacterium]
MATDDAGRGRVSLELTPRDEASLERELERAKRAFPGVDTVNIPDLLRFPLRSWEGCVRARHHFSRAVPHIRAIDLDPDRPLPMVEPLQRAGLNEVLVVTGDPPQELSRRVYPHGAVEVIRRFKREWPEVKAYAALDPYRAGFREEMNYVRRKVEAGADGFFTQPFFDLRLMELYAELMEGREVFWGVSPVMSEKSRAYWETRNRAIFPKDFRPTLAWNRAFAAQALAFVRQRGDNIYFMPILTDVVDYLEGILE